MSRVPGEPSPNDIGVTIETFLQDLIGELDEVRAVSVAAGVRGGVDALGIMAHTPHAPLHGEPISLYESEQTWVNLTNVDGQEFVLPIHLVASCDGPPAPGTIERLTTVYCDDGWDIGPIALEEGLERLRETVGRLAKENGANSIDQNEPV